MSQNTTVERSSALAITVRRRFEAPAPALFEAWTTPALLRQWWTPQSIGMTFTACDIDLRVGGGYRFAFEYAGASMEFFGKYTEVVPGERLVWTNEEGDGGVSISTVTFEPSDGGTLVVLHEAHPSAEAADAALEATACASETHAQLDALLAARER